MQRSLKGSLYAIILVCQHVKGTVISYDSTWVCCVLLHWKSCCPSLVCAWMPALLTTFSHMSAVFANKLIVILVRQTPPQLVVWVWISNLISAKKKDTLHAQNYVFPQWTGSCSNLTPHRCSVCCLDNWGPLCVSVSLCLCACVYVLLSTLLTSCSWHCSRCGSYPLNWTPLTF